MKSGRHLAVKTRKLLLQEREKVGQKSRANKRERNKPNVSAIFNPLRIDDLKDILTFTDKFDSVY